MYCRYHHHHHYYNHHNHNDNDRFASQAHHRQLLVTELVEGQLLTHISDCHLLVIQVSLSLSLSE